MKKSVVSVENLSVCYGQTRVLTGISFMIEEGDFVGLVGPNGGGKTTLVKTILGLVPAVSGEIFLFGKKIKDFGDFSKIGYLPQKQSSINKLFPASVEEIVFLGLLSKRDGLKRISGQDKKEIENVLRVLEILDLKEKMFFDLSGGQQQKTLLARALVGKPELLILDEPSSALDPVSRQGFFKLVAELNRELGITVILITHDTGYIGSYAKKLLYVDGKLIFFGKISDFCPQGDIASCFEKSEHHIIWHQHDY